MIFSAVEVLMIDLVIMTMLPKKGERTFVDPDV
jgi:hypothetical protein